MASLRPSIRIAAPSLLLAVALASGSAAPAIARDRTGPTATVLGAPAARSMLQVARVEVRKVRPAILARFEARPATADLPVATPVAVSRSVAHPTTTSTSTTTPARSVVYRGRNHVWIPSLGVNRSISFFGCSNGSYPGNRVYRWGCAGSNNVYLFGHASSVFEPLHDAYVAGRLHKGMAVWYANGDGVVHRYTVRWWKVTTPDNGAWAYASQSRPSLTLQTCVGARSQYRLIVRLVQSD